MLYTKDLEDTILYIPALSSGSACNSLNIVSGFTDCERISSHLIVLFDGIKEKKYVSRIETYHGLITSKTLQLRCFQSS